MSAAASRVVRELHIDTATATLHDECLAAAQRPLLISIAEW